MPGKVKTLDKMMAYIDENNNITSTPPDPARKKIVIEDMRFLKWRNILKRIV
jgi:hypothetical protein